ncbi:putative polyphosphate/ATP-dependent NAD kinase [Amorphus suaedae]
MRIGLIVNPIAGLGGAAGLKGTDGPDTPARALFRGATPVAGLRASEALRVAAAEWGAPFEILTVAGDMGAVAARAAGLAPQLIALEPGTPSTASDTVEAARALADAAVDLIVFAGGDGTARDVVSVTGERVPVLGIPTGVKMHSAVFAASPARAGRLLAALTSDRSDIAFAAGEVMDIDETALRAGILSASLYGYGLVPVERRMMQPAKGAGPRSDDAALEVAARAVARTIAPGTATVIGPGRTAKGVLAALGLRPASLLGVDVVRDGGLIGTDLSCLEVAEAVGAGPVAVVVGVVGGQGFLFGRGNQQIGPDILRRAGRAGITVLAGRGKLAGLARPELLVDTGDPAVDALLAGYMRVMTGPAETLVMRVTAASTIDPLKIL